MPEADTCKNSFWKLSGIVILLSLINIDKIFSVMKVLDGDLVVTNGVPGFPHSVYGLLLPKSTQLFFTKA
jgi:hypothetical protein